MNDKFKELMQKTNPRKVINDLIQKATGYTMQVYEVDGVRTFGERVEVFDKEKFAELIVRECARISNEVDYTMTNQGAASAQAFMEHFGIEE